MQLNFGHKSAQDPGTEDGWRAGIDTNDNHGYDDDVFRDVSFPTL